MGGGACQGLRWKSLGVPEEPLVRQGKIKMNEVIESPWVTAANVFGRHEMPALFHPDADPSDGFLGTGEP
jgi:hypothetical protein